MFVCGVFLGGASEFTSLSRALAATEHFSRDFQWENKKKWWNGKLLNCGRCGTMAVYGNLEIFDHVQVFLSILYEN